MVRRGPLNKLKLKRKIKERREKGGETRGRERREEREKGERKTLPYLYDLRRSGDRLLWHPKTRGPFLYFFLMNIVYEQSHEQCPKQ